MLKNSLKFLDPDPDADDHGAVESVFKAYVLCIST